MSKAELIYQMLLEDKVTESKGSITMNFLDVKFKLNDKSAIGNILQEWLGHWMERKGIYFRPSHNTQEPPDYYLSESDEKDLLELKTFDSSASANFDVANFDAYIRSIMTKAYKIDCDYLIMGYELNNGELEIKSIWLKKIWEICSASNNLPIKCQVKQKKIVNIRPTTWSSKRNKFKPFDSKKEFILALDKTIKSYSFLSETISKDNWLKEVSANYKLTSGKELFE